MRSAVGVHVYTEGGEIMKKTLKKKVGEGSWSIKGGFEPPLPIGSPVHFEQSNLMVFQKRGEIMKKVPKTKTTVGSFKILKETPEKFVRMDVVMDDTLMDFLLKYADENSIMSAKAQLKRYSRSDCKASWFNSVSIKRDDYKGHENTWWNRSDWKVGRKEE